jgi:hypothetical protein
LASIQSICTCTQTTGARLASFLATIGLLSLLTQGTQEMLDQQQHPGISPANAASSDVIGASSSAGDHAAEDRHDQRDDVQVEDEISNPLAWALANSKRMAHIPYHHQLRFSNMQLTLLLRKIDTMSSNLDSSSSSSSSAIFDHPPPPATAAKASDAAGAVIEEMSEQGHQSQSRGNEELMLVKKRLDDGEAVVTSAETHDKVGRLL